MLPACAPRVLAVAVVVAVVVAVGCGLPGGGQLAGRATDEWIRSYPLTAGGEVQMPAITDLPGEHDRGEGHPQPVLGKDSLDCE